MKIMTVQEAAQRWGITPRRVTEIIREGRMEGVYKIGTTWVMPDDTPKPIDKRVSEKNKQITQDILQPANVIPALDTLSAPFQKILHNPELNLQIYNTFPIPIEIFASDGTVIYANRAKLELNNIKDANLLVGKYNLRNDPVSLEIIGQKDMDRIFNGETVTIQNFPAPIQDLVDRGVIDEKPWEAATMDLSLFPVWDKGIFVCTVCLFFVKNTYQGKAEIIRAQEYMQEHWLEDFDRDKIAKVANVSAYHFSRVFKQYAGMSLHDYYKQIKVNKLMEKLCSPNLTISQAFADCGVDSKGAYLRYFKEITGMTPSEYRKRNIK